MCFIIAFEYALFGIGGYLAALLFRSVPPPGVPAACDPLYGEVERDRDLDAYADGGGTGEFDRSRVKIRLGLKGGD